MKHNNRVRVSMGLGIAAMVMLLGAASPVSAAAAVTGNKSGSTDTKTTKQEKELRTTEIKLNTQKEIQEKLKAIDEYQKLISSKEIDWYAGGGSWNDPSAKFMIPTDCLTYEIVFLGEEGYPVLYLDNDRYASHADGYQELIAYGNGKLKALVATDKLYFYPGSGIVVSQHFGGGYGEVSRNYWLFDADKGDVDLIAQEYHLTPEANIMEYTKEDIDAMVKNGATAGEYMDVYKSPVHVGKKFDWSSKKDVKELTTRREIIDAFEKYFNDYGEYETFKKEMEIFGK